MTLPATGVVTAMEENVASHLAYLPRHLDTGTVHDESDILLVDSGLPSDTFNAVARARLDGQRVDRAIGWVIGHFRSKNLP